METLTNNLIVPAKVSEYIQNFFKSDFLSDIQKVTNKKGDVIFLVELSHDNTLYHLKFDHKGNLLHHNDEALQDLKEGLYFPDLDA